MREYPAVRWIAATLLLAACSPLSTGAPQLRELRRAGAPGLPVEAVVAEGLTNATVATPTYVYILPIGQKAGGEPVFIADHVEGLAVSWESKDRLHISARTSRTFRKNEQSRTASGVAVKVTYSIENEER